MANVRSTKMKITPFGAAGGEVTGSAYLVQTEKAAVLVDCGMFQGGKSADKKNRSPLGFGPAQLDAVLLTHAHLDHCGRLPLLLNAGYTGPIYATPASVEMAGLILRDSAKIQAQDTERKNRKLERAGEPLEQPLYSSGQAESTLALLRAVDYHSEIEVAPGIHAFFAEAGHMLGSASIRLTLREGDRTAKVVFSGDLGPKGAPILRDYEPFQEADMVVLESTYGDHDHRPFRETVKEFFEIVKTATAEGGHILIPTFAVGRAQLLTMLMAWAFRNHVFEPFPVFLDSPMAAEAWRIYRNHKELFDDEMNEFLLNGQVEQDLATLHVSATADESKKINEVTGPCMVMAGAGMCTAGRILHHLKQHLWKPQTHVVIVGYQAEGSLGRMLIEGVKQVKIFGEKIAVRGKVHTLGGFSAHAGQTDLLSWFEPLGRANARVALTHGEDGPRRELASQIHQRYGLSALLPALREEIVL